jgi:hypothetical protein
MPDGQGFPEILRRLMKMFRHGSVSRADAIDIVNRVNSVPRTDRVSEFVTAAEFFGAVEVPVNGDWTAKLEYAYLIAGYGATTLFPGSEFSVTVHMPTLIAQYVIVNRGVYNVKTGFGIGYHFGTYEERYGTADTEFTGDGIAAKLDLEANTAFGENFFGYLGGDIRWDFVGDLKSSNVHVPDVGPVPALNFFSIGAKLGFTWYF